MNRKTIKNNPKRPPYWAIVSILLGLFFIMITVAMGADGDIPFIGLIPLSIGVWKSLSFSNDGSSTS